MSATISITDIKVYHSQSLRAFVDLEVNHVKILGASLREFDGKLRLLLPAKPSKNGKRFFPIVELPFTLQAAAEKEAIEAYTIVAGTASTEGDSGDSD